mmetsp:Transcript_7824/g.11571  ORF Transcript_7824/g.11571 Transcript_7824/m.11571 type:complete len:91 (-) Transcript_7824:621-893(-)
MIFLSFFRRQASNQSKTMTILDGKKVPFEKVDGMDPEQRDRRNELFNISGIRGNYPQVSSTIAPSFLWYLNLLLAYNPLLCSLSYFDMFN